MRKREVVENLYKDYINSIPTRGIISKEWVTTVKSVLNLESLSRDELKDMYDLVQLVGSNNSNHYMINRYGDLSDIEWRTKEQCPLKDMTLEETLEYYKNEAKSNFEHFTEYEDAKSAFLSVIELVANKRN